MARIHNYIAALVCALFLAPLCASDCRAQAQASPAAAPAPEPAQSSPAEMQSEIPFVPQMVPDASGSGIKLARTNESTSELTLKGSDLFSIEPLMGSREEFPTFTRELWQVAWRVNDPIYLWIILPHGVQTPPVVLYLYGYPSETDRFRNDAYDARITAGGAAAVGFVSALTGHRADHRPLNQTFISELPEALTMTVHDIPLILDVLEGMGKFDMKRVGFFGQGSGAAIALLAASVEPRIKALDLLDPWGAWPDWFASAPDVPSAQRADYLRPEFQKSVAELDPVLVLPNLKSRKIRIQFVADKGEPRAAVDRIAAAAPASATVVRFDTSLQMYKQNSNGRLFSWIATELDAHPSMPEATASGETASSPASAHPNH